MGGWGGRDGGDCLTHSASNVKLQKFLLDSTNTTEPLASPWKFNSKWGKLCLWSCVERSLSLFVPASFFSLARARTQRSSRTKRLGKTPTEALSNIGESKKSRLKSQWLFIDSAFCELKDSGKLPCGALQVARPNRRTFPRIQEVLFGDFARVMNNSSDSKLCNAPKKCFSIIQKSVGKISLRTTKLSRPDILKTERQSRGQGRFTKSETLTEGD